MAPGSAHGDWPRGAHLDTVVRKVKRAAIVGGTKQVCL